MRKAKRKQSKSKSKSKRKAKVKAKRKAEESFFKARENMIQNKFLDYANAKCTRRYSTFLAIAFDQFKLSIVSTLKF